MAKNRLPPVPPAGRTGKIPGEDRHRRPEEAREDAKPSAPNAEMGGSKNIAVNTTNEGER